MESTEPSHYHNHVWLLLVLDFVILQFKSNYEICVWRKGMWGTLSLPGRKFSASIPFCSIGPVRFERISLSADTIPHLLLGM